MTSNSLLEKATSPYPKFRTVLGTSRKNEYMHRSIQLHADYSYSTQSHHAHHTYKHHPAEHGPEDDPVTCHEGTRGRLVGVGRVISDRCGNNLGHTQSNRSSELCACIEYGAAQGLHMPGKHVGDDEEADGEEKVAADGSENLDETALVESGRVTRFTETAGRRTVLGEWGQKTR